MLMNSHHENGTSEQMKILNTYFALNFFFYKFIYFILFIYGCTGSLLLRAGFL